MFPENPKEIIDKSKETTKKDLSKLKSEVDQPWQMKFLRESNNKKYDIYGYKLVQWWTKWWIKNKYIEQIWPWVEWTQFTDAGWNEIKKDKFVAWEIVYLRVPKKEKNEYNHTPWKFEYIRNTKDNENRNWKVYSYTFSQWGNLHWVSDKRKSQMWSDLNEIQPYKFCDEIWNTIKKYWKHFNKWETIYLRIPNTDIIDPTPEMSKEEIMKISDNDLIELDYYYHRNRDKLYHKDKLWNFLKLNNKKIYWNIYDNNKPQRDWAYINIAWSSEYRTIAIYRKTWNKLQWVFYNNCDEVQGVYRWELKWLNSEWAIPPSYYWTWN